MGGIAAIARAGGHRVTGCDANVYPPMSTQLEAEGIELTVGYGADQAALNPDLWVIGNVVTRGNPLVELILDRGDRYVSGPQWLAENTLFGRQVLAVAGTHGKTTTSSMLAWILVDAGLAPGFLIGGVPLNFGVSAKLGKQSHFVIEADEYDTAFFDKRSKMVHYRPRVAVLNNIEFDHADIFTDLAAIETQFHHFVRTHNLQNALAAVAAAQAAGVDPVRAVESFARFKGVRRRMELRGRPAGVAVWDDFAHHPTAIATTVSGLRDKVGSARILAVLELRSNTMRAGLMKDRLAMSLEHADKVFCYSANLGWDASAALAPLGDRATVENDLERLVGAIVAEAQPGDQVLVMSNGGFGGIHERLLTSLSTRAVPATGA